MKVQIVSQNKGLVLVQWNDEEGIHRGKAPEAIVVDGEIEDSLLSMVIPYGIDWAYILDNANRTISPVVIAQNLQRRGIWTLEDARAHPQEVLSAIISAYGVTYHTLVRLAEEYSEYYGGLSNG